MYTIISGTNRPGSITRKFSEVYEKMLRATGAEVQYLHLEKLPEAVFHCDVYEKIKHPDILQLQDFFAKTEKFIFIFPEYNGSYPGILKLLVDVMDPRIAFHDKKAGMIGISTGRAGNLRGLDQFASVLHHMNVTVMPYLLPVSKVQAELTEGHLSDTTSKLVVQHLQKMMEF